jgi:8-oxo-dGTP diphosphatase
MDAMRCTLVFLLRDGEILLARKKRGLGAGLINGVGGKIEPGESPEEAAARECREEIGVTPLDLTPAGEHEFLMDADADPWDLHVAVFTAVRWEGEPVETDEAAPRWFGVDEVPYDEMWADDRFWLPQVIGGEAVHGRFAFDSAETLVAHQVEPLGPAPAPTKTGAQRS